MTLNPGAVAWTADGNFFGFTADGFPWWTADGYESVPVPAPPVTPAPPPVTLATVPNVVGEYYSSAQLDILDAGMLIAPPTWVLSNTVLPGYVVSQSLTAGTQQNPQTQLTITVSGFPVVNQPGVVVPVP